MLLGGGAAVLLVLLALGLKQRGSAPRPRVLSELEATVVQRPRRTVEPKPEPRRPEPPDSLQGAGNGYIVGGRDIETQEPVTVPIDIGGPNLTIRDEPPRVSGGLSSTDVRGVLRRHYGHIHRCYEAGRGKERGLTGRVLLHFVIDASGLVSKVIDGGSDLEASVASCIVESIRGLKFPRPQSGTVSVEYPFILGLR